MMRPTKKDSRGPTSCLYAGSERLQLIGTGAAQIKSSFTRMPDSSADATCSMRSAKLATKMLDIFWPALLLNIISLATLFNRWICIVCCHVLDFLKSDLIDHCESILVFKLLAYSAANVVRNDCTYLLLHPSIYFLF